LLNEPRNKLLECGVMPVLYVPYTYMYQQQSPFFYLEGEGGLWAASTASPSRLSGTFCAWTHILHYITFLLKVLRST